MLLAAWEALLCDAVQGLRPPYTPQALRQWLQATRPVGLGRRRPLPTPPLPPPPHQEGGGQGQGKCKGHQGALRHEGTEGPKVRAGTHRDRTPEETPHGGRKPSKNQEGAGAGTKARRKRAPRQTPRPTPRKGIPRRGDQRRPTPTERPTTPGGAPPNTHRRSKHRTPYGSHQRTPTSHKKTTRGMAGTPTRGERATPTEEAAGNAAARRTTTPSPPGNDPGRHKGDLTGTGRGRRHGHSDQD